MPDYSLHLETRRTSRSALRHWKVIFIICILLFVGIYLLSSKFPAPSRDMTKSSPLSQKLEKILRDTSGTYSIYVYDIKKKKEYGVHESTVITAASINKIPILATLYHLAGKGEIDLDKTITPQPTDIQDYGTGSIRYDPPSTPYSLKTLARLMMEKSDNTAAHLLGDTIIGLDTIQQFVDNWGLTQTDMAENKTSAKDMSILLVKMFNKEITTPSLTSEMLGFMEKSDYDDRIPVGIPDGTKIYHKTGDEVGKIHDVGIVNLENSPYYLGILTTDVTGEEETRRTISEISKTVYEAMKATGL